MKRALILLSSLFLLPYTSFADSCGDAFTVGSLTFSCFSFTSYGVNTPAPSADGVGAFGFTSMTLFDTYQQQEFGPFSGAGIGYDYSLFAYPIYEPGGSGCGPDCTNTGQGLNIQYDVRARPGSWITGMFAEASGYAGIDGSAGAGGWGNGSGCGVDGPGLRMGGGEATHVCMFGYPTPALTWYVGAGVDSADDGARLDGFEVGFIVQPAPEPSGACLLGTGLLAMACLIRRRIPGS